MYIINAGIVCTLLLYVWQTNGQRFGFEYDTEYPDLVTAYRKELISIGKRINASVNIETSNPCDSYYDYVCGKHKPLFSILGNSPKIGDILKMYNKLIDDGIQFDAKTKLIDFIISCSKVKSFDDCCQEAFDYFKSIFGYAINRYFFEQNDHRTLLKVLEKFLLNADRTEGFSRSPVKQRLEILKDKLRDNNYFRLDTDDLDRKYYDVQIYRESYKYSIINLEKHQKRNNTLESALDRKLLDFTFYLYQSHNKPMSYYYATLNVHLWMVLYNHSVKNNMNKFKDLADCLKLPTYVNYLEEGRHLAVVYYKSFKKAWEEFISWPLTNSTNKLRLQEEDNILNYFDGLNNKKLFFTLYAQNFCGFGKQVADALFLQGIKYEPDFFNVYGCNSDGTPIQLKCD